MSNLAFFTHEFEGSDVRATADKRFSVYDILVALKVADKPSNAKNVLDRIKKQSPEVTGLLSDHQFPGRGQRPTPVATIEGIEEILMRLKVHPDQKAITANCFYPRTESQIVLVLAEAFADLQPLMQFKIHGYRIDLYLAAANIAIEIDEDGHRQYDGKAEQRRESIIRAALGCSFVRCDPYTADFNLGRVINEIRGLL